MPSLYRILHIDTDKTWRGGQQQVVSLMKQLHILGHRNLLASPPGSAILERVSDEICVPLPIAMRGEWDLISSFQLARAIRREKPDVIHAHSGRAHTLAILAKKLARQSIPVVVSRRVDFSIRKSFFSSWKYKNADFYLPISQAIAGLLVEAGVERRKMEIVYSSVDEERFADADGDMIRREFSLEPDSVSIGNVAICEDRKCQAAIIEAAAIVLQRFPNTHFFIVGDGPLRGDLQRLACDFQIEHRVHLPGFRPDIGNFLKCFNLFVLVPKLEGLGSSILDAQFFSLPVIATPVGGIPEIVIDGETGILVPVNDSERLAQGMIDLIASPETRKRLGEQGRSRLEKYFTSRVMARNTTEAYKKAIKFSS